MPLGLPEMGKLSHVGQGRERGRDPWAPRTTWNFKHDCELAVFLGRGSEPSPGAPAAAQTWKGWSCPGWGDSRCSRQLARAGLPTSPCEHFPFFTCKT